MTYWAPVDVADDRIAAGFERLRARRADDLAGGAVHAGWKVGMNDAGIRDLLHIGSGVVGYLTDRTRADGEVTLGAGRRGAEGEVAFLLGEGGTIPAAACVISAIEDALAPFNVRLSHHPVAPPDILAAIEAGA